MKKHYSLFFLFFGLLLSNTLFAQIVATNQYIYLGENGGSSDLTENVTLNGLAVDNSQVTFTLINNNSNGVILSGSNIVINQGLISGIYTVTYQVFETANPSNFATATLTINICVLPYLIITPVNVVCGLGDFEIHNMPWGNWTLTINGTYIIQGSGQNFTFYTQTFPQESYFFQVTDSNGCSVDSQYSIGQQIENIPLTIVPQTCASPASSLTLTDLPAGNWTLYYRKQNSQTNIINGSGTSYTVTGLSRDFYYFTIVNDSGCNSEEVWAYVGFLNTSLQGSLSGTYVDYNNDGATNLGDIIQYTVGLTNTSNCLMDTFTYSIENAPYILGSFANVAAGATVYSTFNYLLTQNNINEASVTNIMTINGSGNGFNYVRIINNQTPIPLTISDGIKLNAFLDANNDGVKNINEQDVVLGNFVYQVNHNGINHTLYSPDGNNLIYESNPANTYDLKYNLYENCDGQYYDSNINFNNITIPAGSGITTYNFPITLSSNCQDILIYFYPRPTPPRPGFNYTDLLYYENRGSQTVTSGSITFISDNALSTIATSEASATITTTGFTYNYTNLLPNETRTIYVTMLTPTIPTVFLGQLVTNSASITIPEGESYTNNNNCILTQEIGGSFDPNDKTESHGGKIVHSTFTTNDYLTYTIRFENTGTASAISVRVNDLLDAKLDETSIKMVRASHLYVLARVNNNLTWRFDGVNLPPSVVDTEIGKGYVTFQVKPKPGFVLGDIIPNTAEIFFDFNPAIVTNTWTTEFVPFLGVNVFENDTFEYYPNPTSDIVTFNLKNTSTTIDVIEVMDVLGKTLLTKTNHYSAASIDLSSLSKGMYLVKVKANGQEKTVKITKN